MTIPSSEIPPEEDFGSTLEQFRRALASEVGRERLGIDIDANEAASIAADAEQSARWHAVWRTSVRDHLRTGADIIVPGLMQAIASLRHFHRDPLGELHDNHTQVSERLSYGATVGDGHHIDFGDFADFGGSFDGE